MPKRLLSLAGDDRLVEQIRHGNEAAFEVAFERYGAGILSFCRHMLGSPEEAEDAVQHTFASAYRDLIRDDRQIRLKPWLYTIARNRCLSVLRARRDGATEETEVATAGLHEQVQRRAELRDLVRDLRQLPEEQRAALIMCELGDLSHAEIAEALGCEVAKVKALVFRARSGLIQRREARETPCADIRQQLANLRGGSLRRGELRHHLRVCSGCREFREQVRRQRQMLSLVLLAIPSPGLKSSVLGAAGLGGGSGGGGAALGGMGAASVGGGSGGGGAALGGLGAGATLGTGSATLAKVAVVGVLAGGGAVAGEAAQDSSGATHGSEISAARAGPVARGGAANGVDSLMESTIQEESSRGGARRTAFLPESIRRLLSEGGSERPGPGILPALLHPPGVGAEGQAPKANGPAVDGNGHAAEGNGQAAEEAHRAPKEQRPAPVERQPAAQDKSSAPEERRRSSEEPGRTETEQRRTPDEQRRAPKEKRRGPAAATVSFELLDALATKGRRTTADVAGALGVSQTEAERQLREAERAQLVDEDLDETAPPGSEPSLWRLTKKGWKEWDRLNAERDGP